MLIGISVLCHGRPRLCIVLIYLIAVALCNGKICPGSLGSSTDSPFCSECRTQEELPCQHAYMVQPGSLWRILNPTIQGGGEWKLDMQEKEAASGESGDATLCQSTGNVHVSLEWACVRACVCAYIHYSLVLRTARAGQICCT